MAQQESNNRFDVEAKNYRFISRDFLYAIYGINLDAFFSKPLPELPKHKMSLTGEEKNKNLMFLYKEHYEQFGNKLCDSINEAYKKMPSPVITGASSYEFDIELTKAMRNAGAYVLPLRINKGKINAIYHDGSANFKNEYFNLPQHQRLSNSPVFNGNTIVISASAQDNSGDYQRFKQFHDMVTGSYAFKMRDFFYEFEFIRGYLFIFSKNAEDMNEESIFYFVDLPYSISGNKLSEVQQLKFDPETPTTVNCYTASSSGVWSNASANVADRFQTEAASPMVEPEPLTVPLNVNYGKIIIPKPGGAGSLERNNGYLIAKEEIAEPSLRCWMLSFGFSSGEIGQCKNSEYAEQYIEMLNKNICVYRNHTEKGPLRSFPYQARTYTGKPNYVYSAFYWNDDCIN